MEDKRKRDFIAEEISRKIIGPGFAKDIYACKEDCSDEILPARPYRIYQSGIIYPQGESDELVSKEEYSTDEAEDMPENEAEERDNNSEIEEKDARVKFQPTHIGMTACVKNKADALSIEIEYGKYEKISDPKNVKVRLGKIREEDFNAKLELYDRYCNNILIENEISSLKDVFVIKSGEVYLTQKLQLHTGDTDESKLRNVRINDFEVEKRRNYQAKKLISIITGTKKEETYDNELKKYIEIFKLQPALKQILNDNGIESLESLFTIEGEKIKRAKDIDIRTSKLKIEAALMDDPARDLLNYLLQDDYYKREAVSASCVIDISKPVNDFRDWNKPLDLNDDIVLQYKVIEEDDKKYVKLIVQNKNEYQKGPNIINRWLFQTKITLRSNDFIPYIEPHVNDLDEEFTQNELLYQDEKNYGKGVNTAINWDTDNDVPRWISTVYDPKQIVRSFSQSSSIKDINDICDVYNLSIWSTKTKSDIIADLRKIGEHYATWHEKQTEIAGGKLQNILDQQEKFTKRLNDNIKYLDEHDNAFECFKIANTAMYIQMLLGKDKRFRKNRDLSEYGEDEDFKIDSTWEYFKDPYEENKDKYRPSYRPFQLAFLLMNVKSTFENDDEYRKNIVDLIWFPTGGGKTEAYLALTALTIAQRRQSQGNRGGGVSVIMRYTLRLLTSQQFERASLLICALEYLRRKMLDTENNILGKEKITIGMWIGSKSTPNSVKDLESIPFSNFFRDVTQSIMPKDNPFPISYCPWCGSKMIAQGARGRIMSGYDKRKGNLNCINDSCCFEDELPIVYIDDNIYKNPPTLLFATVDKFATLTKAAARSLFGFNDSHQQIYAKPDLIIQDELHLINGPLGSMVGMYESIVEELSIERDENGEVIRTPKIIASTATTRNTKKLVNELYNREVRTFPVSGVRYDDNFFSKILSSEKSKRLYVGMIPTGHTFPEMEINLISATLVARYKLIIEYLREKKVDLDDCDAVINAIEQDGEMIDELDRYWTLVLYYTNRRSLSLTDSRMDDEVADVLEFERQYSEKNYALKFLLDDFKFRTSEFTARKDSATIKQTLIESEKNIRIDTTHGTPSIQSKNDIVEATNMISVGIDIARWDIMIMVGQPLYTSEYIQSSSRVGRTYDGLVITLYNPLKGREGSYYENFNSYHNVFYKYVEPLSVTSFTHMTLEKLALNIFIVYMQHIKQCVYLGDIKEEYVKELTDLMKTRCNNINGDSTGNSLLSHDIEDTINKIYAQVLDDNNRNTYVSSFQIDGLTKVSSLRDVAPNSYIKNINLL